MSGDSLTELEWVDDLCDRFEADWRRGGRPTLSSFLRAAGVDPATAPDRLLAELRKLEAALANGPAAAAPTVSFVRSGADTPSADRPPDSAGLPTVPGYQTRRELGRGGMGVVYEAVQLSTGRAVALKMVLAGAHASAAARERFENEVRTAARAAGGGVAQVYDAGECDGRPYLSMELCPGGTLADRLRDPLPPAEAAALIGRLARAVAEVHSEDIVHRDLKPGNVLFDAAGVPKVADFGLAKLADGGDGLTVTGAVVGTPSYMAPEQAAGARDVDRRADVYALGAVLYECLTGRPPFKGANTADTLVLVRTAEPVPVRRLVPAVPRDLETICHKCLRKEPGRRYPTAAALADDLDRFLAGRPVTARPVGRAERAAKWVRREPRLAAAVAAAGLLLAAVVAVLAVSNERAKGEAKTQFTLRQAADAARDDANAATAEAVAARTAARREAADLSLANGQRLCQEGDTAGGVLWLAHALATAPDADLQRAARTGLAFWGERVRLRTVFGSPADVSKVHGAALSPDGRWVATVHDWSKKVRVWDAATGRLRAEAAYAGRWVPPVRFSPDGRWLLTNTAGASVRDAATLAPVGGDRPGLADSADLAVSSDGSLVVSGGWKGGTVWDVPTGRKLPIDLGGGGARLAAAFLPDGTGFWLSEGYEAAGWDLRTGRKRGVAVKHAGHIMALAVSPDGKTVVTGSEDQTARVWDAATGKPLGPPLRHDGTVVAVGFGADAGTVLTGAMDGTVRLWDGVTGRPLGFRYTHDGSVTDAAVGPGGGRVLTLAGGTARLFDLRPAAEVLTTRSADGPIGYVAFTHDGRYLMARSEWWRRAVVWEAAARRVVARRTVGEAEVEPWLRLRRGRIAFPPVPGPGGWPGEPLAGVPFTSVMASAVRPDGRVAAAAVHSVVRQWDMATGEVRGQIDPAKPGQRPSVMVYTPDGNRLLVGYYEGVARLCDADTGRQVWSYSGLSNVSAAEFSPDGRWAVVGDSNGRVVRFHGADGTVLPGLPSQPHSARVSAVAFRPDGARLLTASWDRTVRAWAADGGPVGPVFHHPAPVASADYTPDGRGVLTVSLDGAARLWDAGSGRLLTVFRLPGEAVRSAAVSPDGATVFTGSDLGAYLWQVPTPKPGTADELVRWAKAVTGLEIGPDGQPRLLPPDAWRKLSGDARPADPAPGSAPPPASPPPRNHYVTSSDPTLQTGSLVRQIAWSPDGIRLAVGPDGGQGGVTVWEPATGRVVFTLPRCSRPAYSPDGHRLAARTDDGRVVIFDANTGERVREMQTALAGGSNLAFSPDGKRLAAGGGAYPKVEEPATGRVWDAETGRELFQLAGHDGWMPWVAYSPDGKYLATTGKDGKVVLHDPATGRPVRTLAGPNMCEATAFSPDGTLLAAGFWGGATVVWDVVTGAERLTLAGHKGNVFGVAFGPDGGRLFTAGMDGSVREWDTTTGHPLTVLRGHTHWVFGVSVSRDGRLATAGHDRTVRVWASRPLPER